MSKALVFVLIPYSVGPANISDHADRLLEPHAMPEGRSSGEYDYLCRLGPVFNDPITEGSLPDRQKRALHRHVCDGSRLPPEPVPYALVTPDGAWHSSNILESAQDEDKGGTSWPIRCGALLAAYPHCWVVAVWAHS